MIEFMAILIQNYNMKKILLFTVLIFYTAMPVICKDKQENNPQNFSDLGRYVQTLEINEEEEPKQTNEEITDDRFEDEAMLDVAKRFEENSVELRLDDIDEGAIDSVNSDRVFKLQVNETQYNIERNIKAENMIWDGSKSFSQAFYNSSQMAPIPGVVNSQSLNIDVSPSLSASLGQTFLNDSISTSVLFVRSNESMYNTGSVISYKGDSLNLAVGSFSSPYSSLGSGGAVLSSNDINLPKNTGSFVLGSAFYNKDNTDYDTTTGGFFGEYRYKRLKLNAQVGQSRYSNSALTDTSFYFVPEFRISDSLYLKTRFIRNVTQENMQDEFVLTYKPKKSSHNLEFEINASRQYDQNNTIKQRIKFSTTFRI